MSKAPVKPSKSASPKPAAMKPKAPPAKKKPTPAAPPPAVEVLSDEEVAGLLMHPYWERLDAPLDELALRCPSTSPVAWRTELLSWIYAHKGAMTFVEIAERVTNASHITPRKKLTRQVLRGMRKLHLVNIVNFEPEEGAEPEELFFDDLEPGEEEIGSNSLISLTWTGMVWLRRAWQARARLMGARSYEAAHALVSEEEDDGKGNDPYWVENLSGADPEVREVRLRAAQAARIPVASVFDLGLPQPSRGRGKK